MDDLLTSYLFWSSSGPLGIVIIMLTMPLAVCAAANQGMLRKVIATLCALAFCQFIFTVYVVSIGNRIDSLRESSDNLKSPDIETAFQPDLSPETKRKLVTLTAEQVKLNLKERERMNHKLENIGYDFINNRVFEISNAKLEAEIQLTRDIAEDQKKLDKANKILAKL